MFFEKWDGLGLFFEPCFKKYMATDKSTPNQSGEQKQTTQSGEQHINPFREPVKQDEAPSPEEEAEREQQLKEAMTERD